MDTRYKTIFASQVRAIEPTEETRNEVKASLGELRGLLPANINPEDEPALLFVAGNLAVAGYVNLNDDGLDIETALKIYKKFEKQQINLEHDRKLIVGYIVHAGLSELGTDRIITEQEARESGRPFNIAIVFALWRVVNRELCAYIEQASNPSHPDFNALSLSFEMGFEGHRIVVLPKGELDISKAVQVIRPSDTEFERMSASLRANKGSGISPDSNDLRVYRIIDEDVVPLGGGVVTVPAAAVKGLVAIKNVEVDNDDEDEEDEEHEKREKEEQEAKQMAALFEQAKNTISAFLCQTEKKLIKSQDFCVSSITPINLSDMKPADIQALKERLTKASNTEELKEVVASVSPIIDAIITESERQEQARKEAESHASKIEEAKAQAVAAAEKLQGELEAVKTELNSIKQAQAAAEAEKTFNERMTAIDATFDLADDERSEIVADVRGLDNEAFAKWMEKSKKLMKEKTKEFKKQKADEVKASQDALLAKLTEKGVKAKLSDAGFEIEEIIASAQNNQTSTNMHNLIDGKSGDLKELAQKALASMNFPSKK